MRNWAETHKPAASARTHLVAAASLWTVVGCGLLVVGLHWLTPTAGLGAALLVVAAVGAGALKGRFVMRRAADRIAGRIRARGDGRCLGGFLSLRTWGFVAVMMLAGRFLRHSPAPRLIIGFIYTAVGVALLLGAGRLWGQRRTDAADGA